MAFPIPTFEQIRAAILADWRNLDPLVDVAEDSDNYIRATGMTSAILGLYQHAAWGINQYFPDTADIENLVRFASARGIIQDPAASAVGSIEFTGVPASGIPVGTLVQTADGNQYETTAIGTISGGGAATVAARAVSAGLIGNQADDTPGTLLSAPVGIDVAANLAEMGDGTEAETLASLLSRVLERLRQPPAGGNKYDYPRWALEVPGVTAAYGYPQRRGSGTMDIAVLSNGEPAGLALRDAVAAYIDELATPYGDRMILAPEEVDIPITATVVLDTGVLLADVQADALLALTELFAGYKPGDTVIKNRISSIIQGISGVVDVTVTLPAANVTTLVDASNVEMPFIGTVTIGV